MKNYKSKAMLMLTVLIAAMNDAAAMDSDRATRYSKRLRPDTREVSPRPTKKATLNTSLSKTTYVNYEAPKTIYTVPINPNQPSVQRTPPPVNFLPTNITPIEAPPSLMPPFSAPIDPWCLNNNLHIKWNNAIITASIKNKNVLQRIQEKIKEFGKNIEEDSKNINRFDINGYNYNARISDTVVILYLTLFPNIEYVRLLNLPSITNQALSLLKTLHTLKGLVIDNCPQINELGLQNLIHLKHLSCVTIHNSTPLTQKLEGHFSEESLENLKSYLARHFNYDEDFKKSIKRVLYSIYPLTVNDLQQTKLKGSLLTERTPLEQKLSDIFKSQRYYATIILLPIQFSLKEIMQSFPNTNTENLNPCDIANNTVLNITSIFPNITMLKLNNTDVTDIALWYIMKLPNLEYLDLRETNVSPAFQLEYTNKFNILRLFSFLSSRTDFEDPANGKYQDSYCDSFMKLS